MQDSSANTLGLVAQVLQPWLDQLQDCNSGKEVWIGFYHLFLLYQYQAEHVGFVYEYKTRKWKDGTKHVDKEGYNFLKMCRNFSGALRCYANAAGMRCKTQNSYPCGTIFRCWVCAIHLQLHQGVLDTIELLFRRGGVTSVKSVRRTMGSFPVVRRDWIS